MNNQEYDNRELIFSCNVDYYIDYNELYYFTKKYDSIILKVTFEYDIIHKLRSNPDDNTHLNKIVEKIIYAYNSVLDKYLETHCFLTDEIPSDIKTTLMLSNIHFNKLEDYKSERFKICLSEFIKAFPANNEEIAKYLSNFEYQFEYVIKGTPPLEEYDENIYNKGLNMLKEDVYYVIEIPIDVISDNIESFISKGIETYSS